MKVRTVYKEKKIFLTVEKAKKPSSYKEASEVMRSIVHDSPGRSLALRKMIDFAATPMELQMAYLYSVPYSEEWDVAMDKRWKMGAEALPRLSSLSDCLSYGGCFRPGSLEQNEFYRRWDEVALKELSAVTDFKSAWHVRLCARSGSKAWEGALDMMLSLSYEEDDIVLAERVARSCQRKKEEILSVTA